MLPVLTFYHPPGGSDYVSFRIAVNFTAGVSVVSFPVEIIEDAVAECPEEFFLDLEIPQAAADMGVMKGSPDSSATIIITDEDSEYCSNAPLYNINCTTHCAWVKTGNGDFTECANVREEFANVRILDRYRH